MHIDPHTLLQIIRRIEQQMRCPQCGKHIPVDFASVQLADDDFMLLQLKCDTCEAYIVLHAVIAGTEHFLPRRQGASDGLNASSSLTLKEDELKMLRSALEQSGGSFAQLFKGLDQTQGMRVV